MAKMFDKVSQDFMNAIKGVLEAKKVNKHGHDEVGKEDEDIDNDGDSDKSDKYLHARRKAIGKAMMKKEEAETLDELSTDTMRSYVDKASDARGHRKLATKKVDNRYSGVQKASAKLAKEEADQIDEISKATMGRYINKAKDSIDMASYRSGIKDGTAISSSTPYKSNNPLEKKLSKRHKGIETAVKKLTREESEQIDELSKKTLGSYVKKAADSTRINTRWAARTGDRDSEYIVDKRRKGIDKAVDKLTKEEIEMIEAKMAGVAPGSMDCDKHMCATKVFHKEWNEGTPIKTMHADPDAEGLIEWYDVMFDHGIERVMTEDMEVLQAESHMHSKKKMKEEVEELDELSVKTLDNYRTKARQDIIDTDDNDENRINKRAKGYMDASKQVQKKLAKEEVDGLEEATHDVDHMPGQTMSASAADKQTKKVHDAWAAGAAARAKGRAAAAKRKLAKEEAEELDEARGRPKKAGQMDYTVHPITKEKLMHNNPEHMKKIERLQKNKVLEKPKTEANQHIMNQLQKAKTSMQGGSTIQFTHGQAKHVSGTHAAKLLDKYAGMKPDEKEAFQKKISHSHEQLMKHV